MPDTQWVTELTLLQSFTSLQCSRQVRSFHQIQVQNGFGLIVAIVLLEIVNHSPVEFHLSPKFFKLSSSELHGGVLNTNGRYGLTRTGGVELDILRKSSFETRLRLTLFERNTSSSSLAKRNRFSALCLPSFAHLSSLSAVSARFCKSSIVMAVSRLICSRRLE